jgi:hypothetical protein
MGTPVPWTESEDVNLPSSPSLRSQLTRKIALFRKLVSNALHHRAEFYADPSLAAWSSNGGDKINKKLQQLLKKFEASIPGAGEVVNQEVAKYVR